MKSYDQTFGPTMGVVPEYVEEIVEVILEELQYEDSEDVSFEKFKEAIKVYGSLAVVDKAHILDQCIDYANENFYELEDEGIDSDMCEQNFLNAVRRCLLEL